MLCGYSSTSCLWQRCVRSVFTSKEQRFIRLVARRFYVSVPDVEKAVAAGQKFRVEHLKAPGACSLPVNSLYVS